MREKFLQLKQLIDSAQKILIPFHLHPDGDMVGSGLALAAYCQSLGKNVHIVTATPVDPDWSFLPYFDMVENVDPAELDLGEFDLILFVDCDEMGRVTQNTSVQVPDAVITASVDHHVTNKESCSLNIVDATNVSSASQIMLRFFEAIDFAISTKTATLLYWGLTMDTGFFQYGNNQRLSIDHIDAAKLLDSGAPHTELSFRIKRNQELAILKYVARGLANMQLDGKYHFCWTKYSYQELSELKVGEHAYHAITEYIKSVRGTNFGIQLVEEQPEYIRCSVRSRRQDGFDCSKLAQDLGGGGHPPAAGFKLKMPLDEAEKLVLEKAREFSRRYLQEAGAKST